MDRDKLVAAFDEWLRRYNEDPEAFAKGYSADGSYGEGCADFLLKLLEGENRGLSL